MFGNEDSWHHHMVLVGYLKGKTLEDLLRQAEEKLREDLRNQGFSEADIILTIEEKRAYARKRAQEV